MQKWVIGDLHLGHNGIHRLRNRKRLEDPTLEWTPQKAVSDVRPLNEFVPMTSEEQHEAMFESLACLPKRDMVFCMGDIVFTEEWLQRLCTVRARLVIIGGNHDLGLTKIVASGAFEEVYGATKHKGVWLTHIPMHEQELYGRRNLHGHLHYKLVLHPNTNVVDSRYINTSAEYTGFKPVKWEYALSDEYAQECYKKWVQYKQEGKI